MISLEWSGFREKEEEEGVPNRGEEPKRRDPDIVINVIDAALICYLFTFTISNTSYFSILGSSVRKTDKTRKN